ncbi:MAG TPA: 2-dehydropantoate 2-reductase N-terminal domain-containing protein, partial [Acidimicrobiia bacterium]|nr:2-dehydropantoate 2-reductase N-terminal domain-containing protein [Acidimicrobiia bacterium]
MTDSMEKIAVIGAGSWGTTLASLAAARVDTILWARRGDLAVSINETRTNPDYLPELDLPPRLRATDSLEKAVSEADLLVMAVPSHGFRAVFTEATPHLRVDCPVLSLTKGIEQGSLSTMTGIVREVDSSIPPDLVGALTGPNLASEIAAGQPAATVAAMEDTGTARAIQELLMSPAFRVYTNDDVVGCELGGALKNVM